MKKQLASVLMSTALMLSIASGASADGASVAVSDSQSQTGTFSSLTPEQIQSTLSSFNEKYEINEPFSPEDAAFVQRYAISADPGVSTYALSWGDGNYFSGKGLGNYSNVKTEGYLKVDIGVVNNKVQVNMNTTDTTQKYHSEIKNILQFTAFGVLGSDGIGIVASFTLEEGNTNAAFHKFLGERSFLASVAYFTATPLGYVKDNGFTSQNISVNF